MTYDSEELVIYIIKDFGIINIALYHTNMINRNF